MNHSQAQILRALLFEDSSLGLSMPGDSGDWPLFVSSMPDAPEAPNDCGCLYDTAGEEIARLLRSGRPVESLGVQIKIRSMGYETGFALLSSIVAWLSTVTMYPVSIEATDYIVDTVRVTSPIMSLGQDEARRSLLVSNVLVLLKND